MAQTISNFLVGVGFDYDERGAREIGAGIDNIGSKALQVGAVLAGAFGLSKLTTDFAQSRDELGRFAETFGVSANEAQAFGNALSSEGGSLDGFLSQLESIERLRAGLLVGDAGFIAQAGRAGIDTTELQNATTATEAYLSLANQFASFSQQERLNAASSLGLDEASIRLLSQGREVVEETVARFRNIRPITEDSTEAARQFNRQWVETSANVSSVADAIAGEILPEVNRVQSAINEWFADSNGSVANVAGLLTSSLLGNVDPEEVAASTGLPEFLFTPVGAGSLDESTLSGQFLAPITEAAQATVNYGASLPDRFNTRVDEVSADAQFISDLVTGLFAGERPGVAPSLNQNQQTPREPQRDLNVTLQLDSAVLDKRTVRIMDERDQSTIDDIASTTER